MKLYYAKGTCSLGPHIILEELGVPFETAVINLREERPAEFLKINPMGSVPALVLDGGEVLTEAAAILQYLGDQKPELNLTPRAGTMERYRLQESLNFVATEIHKNFGPLFFTQRMVKDPQAQTELKAFQIEALGKRFKILSERMGTQPFLMKSGFTVVDAYLFTVLNWSGLNKIDMKSWPVLEAYMNRIRERPATLRALRAEGLIT